MPALYPLAQHAALCGVAEGLRDGQVFCASLNESCRNLRQSVLVHYVGPCKTRYGGSRS